MKLYELGSTLDVYAADDGSATLVGTAVPYDTPLDLGGIRETFAAGAIDPDQAVGVPLLYGHNRDDPSALLGHITHAETTPEGLRVTASVVDPTMAAKLRRTRPGLSVGVHMIDDTWSDDHRSVTRNRARLAELSVTPLPAYPTATITDVRHLEDTMTDVTTTLVDPPPAQRSDLEQLATRLDQIEARAFAAPAVEQHWSHKYPSLYDYQLAVFHGDDEPRDIYNLQTRAADTGLTGDNAGLIHAQWLRTIQRIVDLGRPGISAFGTAPLPDSGMTFQWPTYTAGAHTAAQPTGQVNELTSVAVDVGASSAVTIGTYGGYMRASYQLLQRSDPSFRAVWEQAVAVNYANVVDNVFVDACVAAATGSVTGFDFSGSVDAADLRGALFAASVDVETATGMPAEFALVATNVFEAIGAYSLLPDPSYGAGANAEGAARASTLRVEVSGIRIIHDRNLAAGTLMVSNTAAAKWHEQGPSVVTQEQVSLLAQDMAIYGYGVTAPYVPAGMVKITAS